MVEPRVRAALLKRLGITKQALSLRAKRIKSKQGPMSTDEAVYLIAHQNEMDLSRYLGPEIVDKIRSLVPKDLPAAGPEKSPKGRRKAPRRSAPTYPLVSRKAASQAVLIGQETFPRVFIVENSIRNLIMNVLAKAYGSNWWTKANIAGIRNNVQRTIDREKKFPHRKKRGLHPIFYANFSDLKGIILNEEPLFRNVIFDFKWFEVEMNEVYMARNNLAHSIPIDQDDSARIRIFHNEWARLLDIAGYR